MVNARIVRCGSHGTTLLELVVVAALFVSAMTTILSFYTYGTQLTSRQERLSEGYRQAVQHLARIETLLSGSAIYEVKPDYVIFRGPADITAPLTVDHRLAALTPQAETLFVDATPGRLALRVGDSSQTLVALPAGEKIQFEEQVTATSTGTTPAPPAGGTATATATTGLTPCVIVVTLQGAEAVPGHPPFSLTRVILAQTQGGL